MSAEPVTLHLHIRGKVQGVYYRVSARDKATALGLTGWVQNEPDGSVSLLASGNRDLVAALEHWCWQGPPGAKVTAITRTDHPYTPFDTFEIRR